METNQGGEAYEKMPEGCVFALDIGTRSIIGMVGRVEKERLCVIAIEKEEHNGRAMVDGQIEDIDMVARVAGLVKQKLEEKVKFTLDKVYVAAAGRALRTQHASYHLELEGTEVITEDTIRTLEAGALSVAEESFESEEQSVLDRQFYLVGYTVSQYYLDNYPISNLLDHRGKKLGADVIATFLPSEVVESLYSSMQKAGMEVAGMTLEPIASMNAAIPKNLRLLNLVLVDIGAGTSDIAAARDGSICGYTMATVAGDEVTECLMKQYLVDFETAEKLKMHIGQSMDLEYTDVLGLVHPISPKEVIETVDATVQSLCKQIAERILEVNGSVPSAVFLVGGGSKLVQVRAYVAEYLGMDVNRVALGGNNFSFHAFSNDYDIKDPEYSTPLGIAVSAGLNLINDSFYIKLNGHRAKLFRSGKLTVRDVLMMNGYGYKHLISRSGQSIKLEIDGKRTVIPGGYATTALLEINGSTAGISDLVQAGDEITFIPAKNGEDAKACVKDMVELFDMGFVTWNDIDIPLGISAMVNGRLSKADTALTSGDKIEVCTVKTVAQLMENCQIDEPIYVNGQVAPPEQILEPGDLISEEPPVKKPDEKPEKVKAESANTGKVMLSFHLNGKSILLEQKESLIPYYVMDMLAHTDVDFSKPQGVIELRVNGGEAGFQTELKNGDHVDIYWSKQIK